MLYYITEQHLNMLLESYYGMPYKYYALRYNIIIVFILKKKRVFFGKMHINKCKMQ